MPVEPPADVADRPVSWSPERIDAIVDSINQMNRISLVPEMSVHRWLSIAAVVAYLVVSSILLPSLYGHGSLDIARAVGRASAFLWLPLYLIWTADSDDRGSLESRVCRIVGWLFMAAPAVVAIVIWIAV